MKTGFLALGTSALGILLYLLALRCHQLFPGESGQYVGYGKASYSRSLSIDKKEWSFISTLHTSSIIPLGGPYGKGCRVLFTMGVILHPGFQKTRLVVSFSIGNPQSVACSLRTKEADTRRESSGGSYLFHVRPATSDHPGLMCRNSFVMS